MNVKSGPHEEEYHLVCFLCLQPKRFRRLARMVRTNLQWARDMHDKHDEETTFVVKNVGDPNEPLTFNVANFKVSHKTYGGLSNRVRRILTKHPLERSNSDLIVLMVRGGGSDSPHGKGVW